MNRKPTTTAPAAPDALEILARDMAAAAAAHAAETAQLQYEADTRSLEFGRPRHARRLTPAKTENLFNPAPQGRLF